jgi:hypothetical protein
MVSQHQQAADAAALRASGRVQLGVAGKIELHNLTTREPREIHRGAAREWPGRPTSLNSKKVDVARWKSDAPIVAMKASNAAGAKGRWFGKACDGTTVLTLRRIKP